MAINTNEYILVAYVLSWLQQQSDIVNSSLGFIKTIINGYLRCHTTNAWAELYFLL